MKNQTTDKTADPVLTNKGQSQPTSIPGENKPNYWKISTLIFATLFLIITGLYLVNLQQEKQVASQAVNQQISIQKNLLPTETPIENKANIFANLPSDLLVKENSISLTPNSGYLIVNSILSNDKTKIAYSEISDCIGQENDPNYRTSGQCDWKYRIYVKDLTSNTTKTLYGYPEDKLSWTDFFVKKVQAGGCPLVYLPIGWSKNDAKVILESVNPTSCGAGGGTTKYLFASVNSNGGSIEGISNSQAKFYDSLLKVIFTGESQKSPAICGPTSQRNNSKLVFFNTETRNNIKVIEEANTDYGLGEVSSDGKQFTYFVRPVTEKDGCAEIDYSTQGEKKVIDLP